MCPGAAGRRGHRARKPAAGEEAPSPPSSHCHGHSTGLGARAGAASRDSATNLGAGLLEDTPRGRVSARRARPHRALKEPRLTAASPCPLEFSRAVPDAGATPSARAPSVLPLPLLPYLSHDRTIGRKRLLPTVPLSGRLFLPQSGTTFSRLPRVGRLSLASSASSLVECDFGLFPLSSVSCSVKHAGNPVKMDNSFATHVLLISHVVHSI